ncbi:MAG: sulfatase, partial [Myxococcales bacterium]|nr:sulfatase [Myxococcales bacterium]
PGNYKVLLGYRALANGDLTVYLDDASIAFAKLDASKGETHVAVDLETDRAGDRTLQFRATKTGKTADGRDGALLLTYAWIVPAGNDIVPPSERPRVAEGTLSVPAGWSVSFDSPIPSKAALVVRSTAGAAAVRVVADGGATVASGNVATGDAKPLAALDLGQAAGDIVRVAIEPTAGSVALDRLRIQTPEAPCAERAKPVKNVLVFLVDTLRADHLTVYNPKTPVRGAGMDALARGAAVFMRAHTHENWTKPSVASLLSGLFPWQHGATTGDAVLPESVDLLSERLQRKGFFTGAFIANGYASDKFGFKQGWATYRNYIREGRRTQANFVAADVLDWLDKRPKDKPFFLYVHTIDPHVPYIPPDELVKEYDPEPYSGPVNFLRDRTLLENIKVGKTRVNDRDKQRLEALYDAEITFHDGHMHSIFEGLKKRGLEDDTLVVLTADHGEELFDHGSVGHGHSVWEELLHIPLIVRLPGMTGAGLRTDAPVGHTDVAPTVFEALGFDVPADLPGRSLLASLSCEDTTPRDVASGFMDGWRTLVAGDWKLVHRSVSKYALYDLANDPGETADVAFAHPIAVRYLRGQLGLTLAATTSSVSRAPTHRRQKTEIDAATKAQLEALGYVGTQAK